MDLRPSDKAMRWLGPLIISAVFAVVILGAPPTRNMLCTGAADEHCLRDWLSATSGWFAGIAAFATIYLMMQQIEDARHQHGSTQAEENRRKLNIAYRARTASDSAKRSINIARQMVENVESLEVALPRYNAAVAILVDSFAKTDFDDIEREFYLGGVQVDTIRKHLATVASVAENTGTLMAHKHPKAHEAFSALHTRLTKLDFEEVYCGMVETKCDEIIRDLTSSPNPI